MTTLLIDGDIYAYQAASSVEEVFRFDDEPIYNLKGTLDDVKNKLADDLDEVSKKLGATSMIVCLSVPTEHGWRKQVLPTYKSNRGRKPFHLGAAKQFLKDYYTTYLRDTLEADDVMGILSTHKSLVKGSKVIVSIDKDMKTIPGLLFNPDQHTSPIKIIKEEADYFHMYQTLVGDTTDGYKGCPGIGDKKARVILMDGDDMRHYPVAEMWKRVVKTYESKGLTEEDALVQARVARIARSTDYDFKKKEIKLWTPPKS